MKNKTIQYVHAIALLLFASFAFASTQHSTPAVGGYDLVTYQTAKRPARGTGHFVSEHEGVTYLFANSVNKAKFDKNPQRYLPAYGGYCAFGVSVGKKFAADPEVWRVVDGRLYLNLDANIQDDWLKDVPARIAKADANWPRIRDQHPSSL
ncbi:MAG: YHS domain-containing (seleno)protein [Pseudomonadales bacterium]